MRPREQKIDYVKKKVNLPKFEQFMSCETELLAKAYLVPEIN
jgi:hypothetical protein